jgi:predicted permease
MHDLRFAFRQLLKNPGFTVTAVLTLALCIGANSAIFSVVHAVLLQPLAYPNAERLVNNSYPKANLLKAGCSIPDYLDRVSRAPSIDSATLFTWESFNLAGPDRPIRVLGMLATPSMFATLRVSPMLGRAFVEAEAQPGNSHVVVLSHALWKDHFGGRTNVVGETVRLHSIAYTVIGVMPAGFQFPQPEVKLWTPFAFTPEQRSDQERGREFSAMIARLKPGATPGQLEKECSTIIAQNVELRPPEARAWVESSGFSTVITPVLEESIEGVESMLWLIQGGVIAALLIGCANVGNLLLTRAVSHQRELAIRSALGAGRWRLARQLGVESLVLFVAGGVFGWLVARWGLSVADTLGITSLPRGETVSLNLSVFWFTLVTIGLAALTFGLLPAWHGTRVDAADALRDGGRTSASRFQLRLRHGLVVAEVALAVMLLTTAGLLYHSFDRLQKQNPGFDRTSVLTARLTMPPVKYPSDDQRRAFADRVLGELKAVPGVASLGFTDVIPFGHNNSQGTYGIVGHQPPPGQPRPHGLMRSVSADYFSAMKIPVLRGRSFGSQDESESEQVVVIDRVLADRYFAGRDPIGQQIFRGGDESQDRRTIVGVVAPVKHQGLEDQTTKETVYFPYTQRPVESFTLVVRAGLPPDQLIPSVRRAIQTVDPEQPLYDIETLASRIDGALQRQRVPMLLLGIFGGMALLLAALGVYGVLAFNVGQRVQEFGIRTALGATMGDVSALVLKQGIRMVGLGIGLGLAGYLAVSRFLGHLVFDITPLDPLAMSLGPAVLFVVAVLACWLPARRAARVDPMEALRQE